MNEQEKALRDAALDTALFLINKVKQLGQAAVDGKSGDPGRDAEGARSLAQAAQVCQQIALQTLK